MTKQERMAEICKECDQSEVCGWYMHNQEDRCEYITSISEGWDYGQQDTLEAVEDYVDKGDIAWTEEFMNGLRQSIDNGKED